MKRQSGRSLSMQLLMSLLLLLPLLPLIPSRAGEAPAPMISMGSAPLTSASVTAEKDDDGSVISALEGPDYVVADDGSQHSQMMQAPNKQVPRRGLTSTSPSGLRSKREGFMHAMTESDMNRANLLLHLLDSNSRPSFQKASRFFSSQQKDDFSVNPSSTYGSTRSNSMDPFIIKELPEIKVKHSVGGLNMHQAEEYWRVIHRSNYDLDTLKGGHVMDAKEGQQKLEFTSIKRTPSQVNVGGQAGDEEERAGIVSR